MTAAQMLAHCAEIQEVSNGKELKNTPFIVKLFRGMIRKMVINDKPYPKNTKTHPQYKPKLVILPMKKSACLMHWAKFVDGKEKSEALEHPLFGKMTGEEKGWGMCTSTWTII